MKSHGSATLRGVVSAGWDGDIATIDAAATQPDPDIRAAALSAWLRCGALTPDRMVNALRDDSPTVRRRAAELAARDSTTPSALVEAITDAAADPDPQVAEAACFALGEVITPGGTDDTTSRAVGSLERVASAHDDPLCREAAVAALGAIGDRRSVGTVLAACSDRATVRRRAVLALAAFDGPEVDSRLHELLEDRDWQVRQAAEDLTAPPAP